MSDAALNYVYNFASMYWNVVDIDANGALDFREYKRALYAFVETNARFVIAAYDTNGDRQLSGPELNQWKKFSFQAISDWGVSTDGDTYAALEAAYAWAQINGDLNTCTIIEIARFQLNVGNAFLRS